MYKRDATKMDRGQDKNEIENGYIEECGCSEL